MVHVMNSKYQQYAFFSLIIAQMGVPAFANPIDGFQKKVAAKKIQRLWREHAVKTAVSHEAERSLVSSQDSPAMPAHGLSPLPSAAQLQILPPELYVEVARHLDPFERASLARSHKAGRAGVDLFFRTELIRELKKVKMLQIPAVSDADVGTLNEVLIGRGEVASSIRSMPSFTISETPPTLGLYYAVMKRYPRWNESNWPSDPGGKQALLERWNENHELPLTNTTLAEDLEFVERLNLLTGRNFELPTEGQVEYVIRGRLRQPEDQAGGLPTGAITTSKYHFGERDDDVDHRANVRSNSSIILEYMRPPLPVRQAPPGKSLDVTKNSFGLIHAIGNVWIRSREGITRGGSSDYYGSLARSSFRSTGDRDHRHFDISTRLVEKIKITK